MHSASPEVCSCVKKNVRRRLPHGGSGLGTKLIILFLTMLLSGRAFATGGLCNPALTGKPELEKSNSTSTGSIQLVHMNLYEDNTLVRLLSMAGQTRNHFDMGGAKRKDIV